MVLTKFVKSSYRFGKPNSIILNNNKFLIPPPKEKLKWATATWPRDPGGKSIEIL